MKHNNKSEYMNITKEELREMQEKMVDSGFKEMESHGLRPSMDLYLGRLIKDPRDFTPYSKLQWLMDTNKEKDFILLPFEKRCRQANWYNLYYNDIRFGEVFLGSENKEKWAKLVNINIIMDDRDFSKVASYFHMLCQGLGIQNVIEEDRC